MGFAAKNSVPVEALVVQGDYVVARRVEQGRPTAEVLAEAIPDLLKSITFPKFMRWGEGNYRFGRPLRRFVAVGTVRLKFFEREIEECHNIFL